MGKLAFKSLQDGVCLDLLDTLYAAPCAAEGWSPFLNRLVQLTGSRSARMLVLDRQAETVLSSLKHNIDDSAHRQYVDHFVNECPWRPELKHKAPGRLYSSYLDFSCPQPAYYRTRFFNDWARHQDIHHGVCGTVWQDDDQTVQLLIQRTRGQGHYTSDETLLINQVVDHVRRAVQLHVQVDAIEQQRRGLADAMDVEALPYLLLDANARILHCCSTAEALLDSHPALGSRDGQLLLAAPRMQARLMRTLRQLGGRNAPGGDVLLLPDASGQPLRCLISPLRAEHAHEALWQGSARPLAIVYLQAPLGHLHIDEALLGRLFDLSEAEARVAADIARGLGPQQIAERYGVSVHTVRTQLKQAFNKTQTSRQNELARLILTSPATRRSRQATLRLEAGDRASEQQTADVAE